MCCRVKIHRLDSRTARDREGPALAVTFQTEDLREDRPIFLSPQGYLEKLLGLQLGRATAAIQEKENGAQLST